MQMTWPMRADAISTALILINEMSSYEYHVVDLIKYGKLYLSYAVLKTCPNLDDICTFHWFMASFLKKMATLRTRNFCQNFMPGETYLHTHLKYIGSISNKTKQHILSFRLLIIWLCKCKPSLSLQTFILQSTGFNEALSSFIRVFIS